MKSKIASNIYFCLFLCLLFTINGLKAQHVEKTQSTIPDILLVKTDGSKVLTSDIKGKSVIVLFQPDCDHCQREAKEIKEHLKAFEDYSMYFVSPAPMDEIAQFAEDYGFKEEDNIFFAYTDLMNILNSFGGVEIPSLYIYGEDKQLVKAFNGETPIGKILLHI